MTENIEQVAIKFTVRGYRLRVDFPNEDGEILGWNMRYMMNGGEWDELDILDIEEQAKLFETEAEACAEVERLLSLPSAIDDSYLGDIGTYFLVPAPEILKILDVDTSSDIPVRFEVVPVLDVSPVQARDHVFKVRSCDKDGIVKS